MGLIADALRANLHTLAQSDARHLRELDQELRRARPLPDSHPPEPFSARQDVKALLGQGSFQHQTVAVLKQLCRDHSIRGFSRLKKQGLCELLEKNGVVAPPRPLENFTKKELIVLVRTLLNQT